MLKDTQLEAPVEFVTAYLNTPLYSPNDEKHVPSGAVTVSGNLISRDNGGIQIQVSTYRNLRGKELEGSPSTLFIPLHKLDHLRIES